MKRRAFLINSTVILLLIPLMLLLATYEDVSYQIIHAQSERMQFESTFDMVSYLELDFQRALEISGKRAIVAVVDYVAVSGNFIDSTYKVNNTIRDLIINSTSPSIQNYPRLSTLMAGQDIKSWISNISLVLKRQGFLIQPNSSTIADHVEIIVAPLDSFRIVIKARILNVTIRSEDGNVVYSGTIPRSGWTYSIIDIRNLEDPMFSAYTGGKYQRSIKACQFAFPQLFNKPLKILDGNGSSTQSPVIGELSTTIASNKIYFGDSYPGTGAEAYVLANETTNATAPVIFNTTLEGRRTSPSDVFNDGDMGVLVFGSVSSSAYSSWCYPSLGYRFNVTIQNNLATNLVNFQVPIYIDSSHVTNLTLLNEFFTTADSDGDNIPIIYITYDTCVPVNFWVEKWDTLNREAIIWVNVTIPAASSITIEIYFDSTGTETLGDPNKVFDFYDDFSGTSLNTTKWITNTNQYAVSNGYIEMWGNWNNRYYINTIRSFSPNVIIEGVWRLGGYYYYDTDLTIGLVPTNITPWLSNSALYAWYDGYGGFWYYTAYDAKSLRIYGSYPAVGSPIYSTAWQEFEIIYTGSQIQFWDSYTDSWLTAAVSPSLNPFYLQIAADTDSTTRYGYIDWIRVRKYASIPPTTTISNQIEQRPVQTVITVGPARAYDIQPFINCILDNRYFGVYGGWSFFERLEGTDVNHNAYVLLADQLQDELGVKYGSQYYPIGLISFMVPGPNPYDQNLLNLLATIGVSGTDLSSNKESSVDYYFLQKYFGSASTVLGYRVYGISDTPDRSDVYLFLDNQTAIAIFGTQGAQDLLQR